MRSIRTIATEAVERLFGAFSPEPAKTKAEKADLTYADKVKAIRESPLNNAYGHRLFELVRKEFFKDTAEHELIVIADEGLYRHLRYKRPGTGMYHFDVVTWPGHLAVTGDMGDFLFTRERDMFPWVAGQYVSYDYWAQKCVAGKTKEYSRRMFEGLIAEATRDLLADLEAEHEGELEYIGPEAERLHEREAVTRAYEQKVQTIESAMDGLKLYGDTEFEAHEALREHEGRDSTLKLYDTWEWDLTDYTYQYLWLCVGMHHVITKYLKEHA